METAYLDADDDGELRGQNLPLETSPHQVSFITASPQLK